MDINESKSFNTIRVTFGHGEVIPENSSQLSCHVLSDRKNHAVIKNVVVEKGENVYVGTADQSSLSNNYLVIRNRKTNTLRWFKTDNFFMLPYRPEPERKKIVMPEESESKREAMLNLNKIMGSKKIKRRVMEAEKINVSVDNIEKTLKTAIKNEELVVEKPENVSITNEENVYLPPHDRNASSIEQVYKVYDLISPEILSSLEEITQDILKADVMKLAMDDRLTPFFMKVYPYVRKTDATKTKLVLFADNLVKFLKEPSRNLKPKNAVICKYSSVLNRKILDDFCIVGLGNSRNRPPSMRDKALCYILVCLLLISDFTVDISVLAGTATSGEYARLQTLLRAIGATKEKDSGTRFRLKLPLAELPTIKGRRKSSGFRKKL